MVEHLRPARLIVVRHGPAELRDPARWPDDRRRPLSAKGLGQTRRAARAIADLVGRPTFVATGPAVRAKRTAELVAEAFAPAVRLEIWPELDVGQRAEPILRRLGRELRRGRRAIVVGHDPVLGELIGVAIAGESLGLARLTKGGAACLEFPAAVRPAGGRLLWLFTRKQLVARADGS